MSQNQSHTPHSPGAISSPYTPPSPGAHLHVYGSSSPSNDDSAVGRVHLPGTYNGDHIPDSETCECAACYIAAYWKRHYFQCLDDRNEARDRCVELERELDRTTAKRDQLRGRLNKAKDYIESAQDHIERINAKTTKLRHHIHELEGELEEFKRSEARPYTRSRAQARTRRQSSPPSFSASDAGVRSRKGRRRAEKKEPVRRSRRLQGMAAEEV